MSNRRFRRTILSTGVAFAIALGGFVAAPVALAADDSPTPPGSVLEVVTAPTATGQSAYTGSYAGNPYTIMSYSGYSSYSGCDGEPCGMLDGNLTTQWDSGYSAGYPYWVVLDLGQTRNVSGIQYQQKQANGAVGGYALYVTDSATVAANPNGSGWQLALQGTWIYEQNTKRYGVIDGTRAARYVKFVITGPRAAGNYDAAGVTELRVWTNPTPIDPVNPPVDPGTSAPDFTPPATVNIKSGDLSVDVAQGFPQIVRYTKGTGASAATLGGQADGLLSQFQINDVVYDAATTPAVVSDDLTTATWVSTVPDFGDVTITTQIKVASSERVDFEMTSIEGADALSVDEITIPNHSLIAVDSSSADSVLSRTKIEVNAAPAAGADKHVVIDSGAAVEVAPVTTPYVFVTNGAV
ncbi:MAG: discoidin domain-containing protein, partial [Bifidobacteriaceae bacterium]|nr:discoidin domain-containing protein [Bifidobacteriaceae bacterium]